MLNNFARSLKKVASVMLLILILASSCFAFVACKDNTACVDGNEHYFSNRHGRCMYCHKNYCEAYGKHTYEEFEFCVYCGQDKSERDKIADGDIDIGTVITVAIVLLVISLVSHRIGIAICSPFFVRAPMVVFLIMTVGAFFAYGVGCGIIFSVCFVIYVVAMVGMNRKYLGYDDVI